MKAPACSQYIPESHSCMSGWPVVSGACFGIVTTGCKSCGDGATTPPCMREEPGNSYVNDDGLPINWPLRKPTSHSAGVSE